MHRNALEALVCPRSGQQLTLEAFESDGEEVEQGVLRSEAGDYPVVSGIPIFIETDAALPELLRAGRFAEATVLAAFGHLPRSRLQRIAGYLAAETGGPVRSVFDAVARRQLALGLRAVFGDDGSFSPAQVLRFAYLASAGRSVDAYNYFAFRYSSPRHLVALSCIEGAPQVAGTVLDFGCGAGHLTWALRQRLAAQPVFGVDKEYFLLLLARHALLPRGAFLCADGAALPIRTASCSLVLASDVLSFVTHKRSVVRELDRVTDSDACLMITSVKNALCSHVYAGEPLTPAGWSQLVRPFRHRVVPDDAILERYLGGRGVPSGEDIEPATTEASRLLSILVAKGDPEIECLDRLGDWPHARGELAVNPLFQPHGTDPRRYTRTFPSPTYLADNPEMADYPPATFTLTEGRENPGREEQIASLCLLGLPPNFGRHVRDAGGPRSADRQLGEPSTAPVPGR